MAEYRERRKVECMVPMRVCGIMRCRWTGWSFSFKKDTGKVHCGLAGNYMVCEKCPWAGDDE